MQYHVIDKKNIWLRRATWESYHKKCVYCGVPMEIRHMQIDHILPSSDDEIEKNLDTELQKYIKELRHKGFKKDCVENYISCCSDCNVKKKNHLFSVATFRFYHEFVARHVEDIWRRYEQYSVQGEVREKSTVNSVFDATKEAEFQLLCDFESTKFWDKIIFKYGLGKVRIDAFIPTSCEGELCCLISFDELIKTGLSITYGEREIMDYLFGGYGEKIESNKRGWCNCYENLNGRSYYEVVLPNIRMQVSKETLEQMSVICDKLYEEYLLQEVCMENVFEATLFPKVGKGKYKLFHINYDIKKIIFSYMRDHQYNDKSGNVEDNIFHFLDDTNKIYLHQNIFSAGKADIYACIDLEKEGDGYDVIWSPGFKGNEYDRMLNFDNIIKWTVDYTYEWFVCECIPSALKEYDLNTMGLFSFLRRKRIDYNKEYLMRNQIIRSYKKIEKDEDGC